MADQPRAGEDVRDCSVEGCDTPCGLLRIAPMATLEQAYEIGCGRIRYLVDVWPHEQEVAR